MAELYSGNIVGWDVRVTDAPEQSSTLYVPIGNFVVLGVMGNLQTFIRLT